MADDKVTSRTDRGLALLDKLDGPNGRKMVDQMGDVGRYVGEFGFGDVYDRPGLGLRDREFAAVAMLIAMGGHEQQVRFHLGAAMNVGLSTEELEELIIQTIPFAGFPSAMAAHGILQEIKAAATEKPNGQSSAVDVPRFLGVRHVGLKAKDPGASADFYREIMGMQVVRQTADDHALGGTVFLGRHPDLEDHDVVLVSNPKAVHAAFRVSTLADLITFHSRLKEKGVKIKNCFNHHISFALYFEDLDDNLLEVYWMTGLKSNAAKADPLDLDQSEGELKALVERMQSQ